MKKVIVVGAGISGLSSAIYAQRSGFDVTICEQHSIAGGMCTSWKRKGYLFEGAVHWLTGSCSKTNIYQLWKDTGALSENVKVFLPDLFNAVEYEDRTISLFRDIKKTLEQLAVISPKDKKLLKHLENDVKAFSNMQMMVLDIKGVKTENPKRMTLGLLFKMMPALLKIKRLMNISCKDYAEQFSHFGIQRLFRFVPDDYSAVSLIATMATLNTGDGGYPEGGSLGISERMKKTFQSLGGNILLNTKVKKVIIENGITKGVMLENESLEADAVIVTQDAVAAAEQLFDPPLQEPWLDELRKNVKPMVCTFIGVGIRAELPGGPVPEWKLDEPITYAGKTVNFLSFYNYTGHDGYAPEGCTALTTIFMGDTYDFWKKAKEEGRYDKEKKDMIDQISRAICKKYPQLEGKIDLIDIATPLTYERYTGAYRGSWMKIVGAGDKMTAYPGFINSVSGLFFAGQRLMGPGGLPVAVVTGRKAAQMVCRHFDVMFK